MGISQSFACLLIPHADLNIIKAVALFNIKYYIKMLRFQFLLNLNGNSLNVCLLPFGDLHIATAIWSLNF